MPTYPTLPNAPITEALLDIQVASAPGLTVESLGPFCDAVAAEYPGKRLRKEWRAEFSVSGEGDAVSASPQGGVVGYLLSSADGSQIVQARVNGFSFSRLRPYRDWNSMRDEARRSAALVGVVSRADQPSRNRALRASLYQSP